MNPEHAKLLGEVRQAGRPSHDGQARIDSYGGSGRLYYSTSAPALRAIARRWLAARKSMDPTEFLAVVESLFEGQSHDEKTLAALLVGYNRTARRTARPADLDRWLGHLNGWAEIDALCQNVFTADDMLADWPAWEGLIDQLSRDPNINKRRAALVLLNSPVRYSSDVRFQDLALAVIDRLQGERAILITKAVSWLLRSMIVQHRGAVEAYLAGEQARLPKIAVRETRAKLATGLKSGRTSMGKKS